MSYLLETPAWLWLALLAVPMVVLGAWMFQAMTGVRRWASVLVRAGLIVTLALLLAGLSSRRETNKLAVVAVVDVSGSVQRFGEFDPVAAEAPGGVRGFLERALVQRTGEDLVGVVAFDGAASVVAMPTGNRAWQRDVVGTGAPGTNIGEALRLAGAMIPPDAAGRIVLISDGNQTAGDALAAVREVSARRSGAGGRGARLPVDVAPVRYSLGREVLVESLDAPPTAPGQATVNVRVVLWATAPGTGTLRLLREGQSVDLTPGVAGEGRRIALEAGRNVELLEVELGEGRVHRFEAVYEPDVDEEHQLSGDTIVENNRAQAFTITPGRGRVLLVDGVSSGVEGQAGTTLAQALRRAGLDVSVVAPDAMPTEILRLQGYDLVILENVGVEAMDEATQQTYVAYVRDLGGGLVMVGGPNSFGAGGWKDTPIAGILPVEVEIPDKVIAPQVATVFVLDNSGSMRRPVLGSMQSQQQLANDAAALAIRSLDRSDLVGVVVFNSEARTLVPLTRNSDPDGTMDRVRDIRSGGGTDLADGLEEAIDQLRGVRDEVKTTQVIVLTDGKSLREEELPGLVDQLVQMGAKVTTIAVGDDADTRILAQLAERGGGAFHYAANPRALPRIFLKAVRVVRSPLVREEPFAPVTLASGSAMIAGLRDVPELGGLVLTRRREDPTVALSMAAPTGEPVLASWQVGLGQVVAFTSDAHAWARTWLDWPGYERMWAQIVRTASRAPDSPGFAASAQDEGGRTSIRVEARNDDGSPRTGLAMPATIYQPDGSTREVVLQATAPGVYEASLATQMTGSYVMLVKPAQGSQRLQPVVLGTTVQEGAEFRALASNDALLEDIARTGGGRLLDLTKPEGVGAFDRSGIEPAEAITPLWQALMLAGLGLFLLDVATRRIAWDRWTSRAFAQGGMQGTAMARGASAVTLAGLRGRLEESGPARSAAPEGLTLSQQDAERLAMAARDRRRAQRLAASVAASATTAAASSPVEGVGGGTAAAGAPASSQTTSGDQEAQASGGLLAAKRRASRRFDES